MNNMIRTIFAAVLMLTPLMTQADAGKEAQAVVKQVTDDVLLKLAEGEKKSATEVYEIVREIVVPHFDSVRMARLVLGKHWRKANKEQKLEFTKQFRTLLVRTYGTALANYTDQEIQYDAPRVRKKGDRVTVTVRTRVIQSSGAPDISIAYSLRSKASGWKVNNVTIEGVSLVTNYRSEFSQKIGKNGLDALIKGLKKRNGE